MRARFIRRQTPRGRITRVARSYLCSVSAAGPCASYASSAYSFSGRGDWPRRLILLILSITSKGRVLGARTGRHRQAPAATRPAGWPCRLASLRAVRDSGGWRGRRRGLAATSRDSLRRAWMHRCRGKWLLKPAVRRFEGDINLFRYCRSSRAAGALLKRAPRACGLRRDRQTRARPWPSSGPRCRHPRG